MTDIPRAPPEHPIIWSPGRPATGRVNVLWTSPFTTFEYLFFQLQTVIVV